MLPATSCLTAPQPHAPPWACTCPYTAFVAVTPSAKATGFAVIRSNYPVDALAFQHYSLGKLGALPAGGRLLDANLWDAEVRVTPTVGFKEGQLACTDAVSCGAVQLPGCCACAGTWASWGPCLLVCVCGVCQQTWGANFPGSGMHCLYRGEPEHKAARRPTTSCLALGLVQSPGGAGWCSMVLCLLACACS
jgi:hypothetical protein